MIYIDPPYGKDDLGQFAQTNYDNAISRDNLLSMLYPRLQLAKQLLKDDGVIFCSIDDKNQAYVKCLFDEVFGEGNFVSSVFVLDNLKGKANENFISSVGHTILIYTKNFNFYNDIGGFNEVENLFGNKIDSKFKNEDEKGYYTTNSFCKTGQGRFREDRPTMYYSILYKENQFFAIERLEFEKIYDKENKKFNDNFLQNLKDKYENLGFKFILPENQKGEKLRWTSSYNGYTNLIKNDELIYTENSIMQKKRPDVGEMLQVYASGIPKSFMYKPQYANGTDELDVIFNKKMFDYPKSISLIKDLLKISTTANNGEATERDNAALKNSLDSDPCPTSGEKPEVSQDSANGAYKENKWIPMRKQLR